MSTEQSKRNHVRRPMKRIGSGAFVLLIVLYTSATASGREASPNAIRLSFAPRHRRKVTEYGCCLLQRQTM